MKLLHRLHERAAAWRLPVRIPVPNRDDLIAIGLMTLAFGLMIGVAIGPALGAAGSAVAGIVAPAPAPPPAATVTESATEGSAGGVTLGSPAGSESGGARTATTGTVPPADSEEALAGDPGTDYTGADYPDEPAAPEENPARNETDPVEPSPEQPAVEGTELKGVVVGVDPGGKGYDVADSSGNVLALHAAAVPAVGVSVVTRIDPLANGTFAEVVAAKAAGREERSKLRGTITWVDPAAGLATVSNRGSSLAVDLASLPGPVDAVPGSPVEATVALGEPAASDDGTVARPGLVAETIEVTGDPLETFDLNGRVGVPVDDPGQLTVTADGAGVTGTEQLVTTPEDFDPARVTSGWTYNLTVERAADGTLRLTGLAADQSRKTADEPAVALGPES